MSDERIIALQEKIAYLEHDVETLDGVVRELHDQMDTLIKAMQHLREEIRDSKNAESSDIEGLPEVPPSHRFPSERDLPGSEGV